MKKKKQNRKEMTAPESLWEFLEIYYDISPYLFDIEPDIFNDKKMPGGCHTLHESFLRNLKDSKKKVAYCFWIGLLNILNALDNFLERNNGIYMETITPRLVYKITKSMLPNIFKFFKFDLEIMGDIIKEKNKEDAEYEERIEIFWKHYEKKCPQYIKDMV